MQLTRKEDISLYLYVRDCVIGPEFYEVSEAETLSAAGAGIWQMSTSSDMESFGRGRGLLYFDVEDGRCLFGTEQSETVEVYSGGTTASGYTVDYLGGRIFSSEDLSSYNVDYLWNYVGVLDAWPYTNVPPLPLVSIELQEAHATGLQLGYGDIRNAYWNIQIFATNKGERDDLMDVIYAGIHHKRCSIYEFDSGLPIKRNGTFNESFNLNLNAYFKSLQFDNVRKALTGLPSWGFYSQELINRYRAEITFETKAYEN